MYRRELRGRNRNQIGDDASSAWSTWAQRSTDPKAIGVQPPNGGHAFGPVAP